MRWRAIAAGALLSLALSACGGGSDTSTAKTTTTGGVVEELDGSDMSQVAPTDGSDRSDGTDGTDGTGGTATDTTAGATTPAELPITGCGRLTVSAVKAVLGVEPGEDTAPDADTCALRAGEFDIAIFRAPAGTDQPGTTIAEVEGATWLPDANRIVVKAEGGVWFIGLDGGDFDGAARKAALVQLARGAVETS